MALIQNAIMTPDGTILVSGHTHDFVVYRDKNYKIYGIDGGLEYVKGTGDWNDVTSLILNSQDCIERIVKCIVWGTRPAINAKQTSDKVVYRFLKDLDTEHLKNIAKTQQPSIYILMAIFYILNERGQLWK